MICCRCEEEGREAVRDGLCQEHLDERAQLWAEEADGERIAAEIEAGTFAGLSGETDLF